MVSPCATGNCITRPRRRRIAYWLAAVATIVSFDSTAVEVPLYAASSGMQPSDPAWGWVYGYDGGGALIDTTGVKRSYRLTVLGSQYTLGSAGESTLIGSLRDNLREMRISAYRRPDRSYPTSRRRY
jgi:hypothetical protein